MRLRNKCIKNYSSKVTESGTSTTKEFWRTIKPFLTNKGFLSGNEQGSKKTRKL